MGLDAGPIYSSQVDELNGSTGITTGDYQTLHSKGTTSLGSWNWGCVAVALDSIRQRLKRAAIWTLAQSFAWFAGWLKKQLEPRNGHRGAPM